MHSFVLLLKMMIKYKNFVKAMSRKNVLILANQTIGKILRF